MLCWDVSFLQTHGTEWGFESFIAILITGEGQLNKCVQEAPLLRQASPNDQINPRLAKSPSL